MSFFDELLNSDSAAKTAHLQERVEKLKKGSGFVKDERYWMPQVGKDGTGFAIIRFLPETVKDTDPWVLLFSHSFKGPTGLFYIKNSPQTLGKHLPCPASELYFLTKKIDEEAARKLSRKVNYISNILVINHPGRPEDNGKVFLYKYGIKIFDKISLCIKPGEPGLVGFDPFDFREGANFRLRVKTKAKQFPNYDDSVFDPPSPLSSDREYLRGVFEREYNLAAEIAPDKFEPYDALKKRLNEVMGISGTTPEMGSYEAPAAVQPHGIDEEESAPWAPASPSISPEVDSPAEAEDLAFFQRLASGKMPS